MVAVLGACGAEEAAAPAGATGPVDSGFRPGNHGFQFENFGGSKHNSELTGTEVRRLFGDSACASLTGDECKLSPVGKSWMKQVNKSMKGGRCEGFAVLSQILYLGLAGETPGSFGGDITFGLKIEDNEKLAREIAYWFATQSLQEVMAETTVTIDGKEALAFLAEVFTAKVDLYRMGIVKVGPGGAPEGGHAITPYVIDIDPSDASRRRILVYDNNHPGQERYVTVDPASGRWEYRAATNPEAEEGVYYGDPENQNPIYFTPTKPRLGTHTCPFCVEGGGKPGHKPSFPMARELRQTGGAELLATDPYGYRVGYVNGAPIAEMPGSRVLFTFSDDTLFQDDPPAMILVPQGPEIDVAVDTTTADEAADVGLIGPGYTLGAEGVETGKAGDVLSASGDGSGLSYAVGDGEAPTVFAGADLPSGEAVFTTAKVPEGAGVDGVQLGVDPATGDVQVAVDSETPIEVEIEVTKATAENPEGESFAAVVEVDPEGSTTLQVSDWTGGDTAMPVAVDTDGDGSADKAGDISGCGDTCDFGLNDNDGVPTPLDNCPEAPNTDQADADGNGVGDACSDDDDGDGIADAGDNCSIVANAGQEDLDGDTVGDVCDSDDDGDGVDDAVDRCPVAPDPDNLDSDSDGAGDVCDDDDDNDLVLDVDDNCPFTSNPDQTDSNGNGQGDACDGDDDGDGTADEGDNCPTTPNADQADTDGDTLGDVCDSDDDDDGVADAQDLCDLVADPAQVDTDGDGAGDACDEDDDDDGVLDVDDNCTLVANAGQADDDADNIGEACDDDDGDTVPNAIDNCPFDPNLDQADTDGDSAGDACDLDQDADGVADAADNCPADSNAGQEDQDGDTAGDACDPDLDGDGAPNETDNCPAVDNADQADADGDSTGDLCDSDADGDTVPDGADNCPAASNPDQADLDEDGTGDACDDDDDGDGVPDGSDNCTFAPNATQEDLDGDLVGDACDDDDDGDFVSDDIDNCPAVPNADQTDTDLDGIGDACDP